MLFTHGTLVNKYSELHSNHAVDENAALKSLHYFFLIQKPTLKVLIEKVLNKLECKTFNSRLLQRTVPGQILFIVLLIFIRLDHKWNSSYFKHF